MLSPHKCFVPRDNISHPLIIRYFPVCTTNSKQSYLTNLGVFNNNFTGWLVINLSQVGINLSGQSG